LINSMCTFIIGKTLQKHAKKRRLHVYIYVFV